MQSRMLLIAGGLLTSSVLAGASLIWWFSGDGGAKSKSAAMKGEPSRAGRAPNAGQPPSSPELAQLGRRVARLEQASAAGVGAGAPPAPSGDALPPPMRPSLEEELRVTLAMRDQHLRAFDQEGYDAQWAKGARSSFQEDLTSLAADRNFRIQAVECKTTLCRATVQWASYSEVQTTAQDIVHANYRQNCTKMLFTPVPQDPNAPYEGTVFYDCTSLRTGETE